MTNIKIKASESKLKNASDRELLEGRKKEDVNQFLSTHKEPLEIPCHIMKFYRLASYWHKMIGSS